jgi:hypothetical protein
MQQQHLQQLVHFFAFGRKSQVAVTTDKEKSYKK